MAMSHFLMLFLLLDGLCAVGQETDPVDVESSNVNGVDLSKYQGDVNFDKLKASGIHYVFIKATQGVDYQDPCFVDNYPGARAAGLVVGAYHFYMTNDDPHEQASNFIATAQLRPGDLPPVIDIESLHKNSLPHLHDALHIFLEELFRFYGVRPIVYTGRRFANDHLDDMGSYPLWIAEYGVDTPTLPWQWVNWHFWQWSQSGSLNGVQGDVDLDRFNGDEPTFRALLIE